MPIFVASPTQIYTGEEAAQRLLETNDLRFASEDGVTAVDEARWAQAQQAERQVWLELNSAATDDHDAAKIAGFNGYADLPHELGRVLEPGCGAFTTVRAILAAGHTAQELTLIDPLADDYRASHQHCAYRDDTLAGIPAAVIASAVEDLKLPTAATFDTVILVNVLGHCRDANRVLEFVQRALKPGGLLIFQEEASAYVPTEIYDVIHPIKVTQHYLDAFLARFEEVYRNGAYFIGWKAITSDWGKPIENVKEVIQAAYDQLTEQAETVGLKPTERYFVETPEAYQERIEFKPPAVEPEPPAQAPAPKKVKRTARKPSKK